MSLSSKRLLKGALAGAFFFFALFCWCIVARARFSVMGVSDPELSRLFRGYLLLPTLLFELKVLLAYLALGGGLGFVSAAAGNGLALLFRTRLSGLRFWGLWFGLLAGFHLLVWARAVVLYPQLFTEFLYEKGGFWKEVQLFLTDTLGLGPVRTLLGVWAGALVLLFFIFLLFAGTKENNPRPFVKRLLFPGLAAGLFLLMVFLANRPPKLRNRGPNLLLLCADSVRPDRMSAYAAARDTTPALSRLAAEGVRFEQVYVQLPRTFPSWVSMLTGLYPFQHGITSMFPSVEDRQKDFHALPELLREKGWTTVVVSDYAGDIFPRISLGFEYVDAPDFNFHTLGRMRGLEIHTHLLPYLANQWGRELFPILKEFASLGNPFFVAHDVNGWLRRLRGKDRFMLTVFFSTTHFPYSPPWPYYRMFALPGYRGLSKYSKFNRINVEERMSEQDIKQVRAVFDGGIRATDDAIAEILKTLENYGLAENTIVLFTADHGENLYEHEYGMGHGDHLRGRYSLQVPLIIRDPLMKARGRVVSTRVREIDLFPTLMELLGLNPPQHIPARSLVPLMKGKTEPDREVYAETGLWFIDRGEGFFQKERLLYPDVTKVCWFEKWFNNEIVLKHEFKDFTEAAKHRMLITGDYKLIYAPLPSGVKWELYDLKQDPEERHDLAEERPQVLARMKKELFALLLSRPGWTVEGDYYLPLPEWSR